MLNDLQNHLGHVAGLDWAMLAVVLVSLLLGALRGLLFEVLSLLGWVVAFWAGVTWAGAMAAKLPLQGLATGLQFAVGFLLIFVAVLMLSSVVAVVVKKLAASVGLRPIDRLLGAGFGLLRAGLIGLGLALVVKAMAWQDAAWWRQSISGPVLSQTLLNVQPLLPANLPGAGQGAKAS